jgi:gp16 family phage-associated protein
MTSIPLMPSPLKTPVQVREEFAARGISLSSWARERGFSAELVYQVLSGRKRCIRGQSHQIAVSLGLKAGILERACQSPQ